MKMKIACKGCVCDKLSLWVVSELILKTLKLYLCIGRVF